MVAQQSELFKAFGGDPNIYKKEAEKLDEKRNELKSEREQAANMRLIEAGLAIMGGESPYAFVNIGKGASAAMKGFAEDVKDLRKQRIELDKTEQQLRLAQNQFAATQSTAAQARVDKLTDRAEARTDAFKQTQARFAEVYLRGDLARNLQEDQLKAELLKTEIAAEGTRGTQAATAAYRNMQTRQEALKGVNQEAIRAQLSKAAGYPKVPPRGAIPTFDKQVDAAIAAAVQQQMSYVSPAGASSSATAAPAMRIVGVRPN
jgi:hypothetical protein